MAGRGGAGPQFMRPTEFDPAAAAAAAQAAAQVSAASYRSPADQLKNEFGLEEDSGGESGDERGRHQGRSHGGKSRHHDGDEDDDANGDMNEAQQEFERMGEELKAANHARHAAEVKTEQANRRVEEITQMAKSAKAVQAKQYGDQIKVLQKLVEESKEKSVEDDNTILELRQQVVSLQRGGPPVDLPKALKELKDSREMTRLASELKAWGQQLEIAGKALQEDLIGVTRERDEARTQLAAASAAGGAGGEIAEVERERYRSEIQKQRQTIVELHARLATSVTTAPALAPAPAGATGLVAPEHDPALKLAASASAAPRPSLTMDSAAAEDIARYQGKIKQLEAKLNEAQAATRAAEVRASTAAAAATAAGAAVPAAAAPAPVPAPGPVTGGGTSAEDAAKIGSLEEMVRNADVLLKRREEEIKLIKAKAQEKLNQASAAIKKLKQDLADARTAAATAQANLDGNSAALAKFQAEAGAGVAVVQEQNNVLKATLGHVVGNMGHRRAALAQLRQKATDTKTVARSLRADVEGMGSLITELGPLIARGLKQYQEKNQGAFQELARNYAKEVKARKDLFNQIQELKGNIRVYCRVRPPNSRERADPSNQEVFTFPSDDELKIVNPEKKTSHTFDFERIFRPGTTQEQVFADVGGLVQSVMDGYNVCIFAYGQTGSGKTYTMEGPREDPGVNLRALSRLFEIAEERKSTMQFEISVTMLEVYNETIQDMLGSHDAPLRAVQGEYGMEVKDLSIRACASMDEVLRVLREGQKSRTTSKTDMNERSSRSHLITSCYVKARDLLSPKEHLGKLHLIDLAGSERVGRSGVVGAALKEAQSINSSLSALGDVIAARATKAAHVPYRNSVLTHLLQDSLEKNSKTLMFVQCSPALADTGESICALKFAHRVRQVELGKASKVEKKSKSAAPGKKAAA